MPEPLVFAIQAYEALAGAIALGGGWELGAISCKTFPDGEKYARIDTDPGDRDVIVVGGTIDDEATLELYDLACAVVAGGAYRLRLVIPFYGYSTMERSTRPGEIVKAKTRARLLSAIPLAARGTQVFLLDLHVASIAYYFEGGVRPVEVYGKSLVTAAARGLSGPDLSGTVLACTDAGRAKWVESLANDLGVPAAFVYKRRHDGSTTEVTGVSAQVAGKRVIIYDDMIRTGGSLLEAAVAYSDAGAVAIDAIATHGLFPGTSLAKLRASGLFGSITVTDSHPRAVALADDFLRVVGTAELFVTHLKGAAS